MWRRTISICLALSALAGCGSDPEIPTLLVTDGCSYTGPTSLMAGAARMTLQRSGPGDNAAALVQIPEDHTVTELDEHFAEDSPNWEERPDWVRLRYVVEVDDTSADGTSEDTVLMTLEPGDHAVVCIDHSDDSAEVAADVAVMPTGG